MNKFFTLNQMQSSCKFDATMNCWELKVTCKMKSVIRSRTLAFIRKINGAYVVTLTGESYKSFMAALARLFDVYVDGLRKLIMSMACPVGSRTDDFESIVDRCVSEFLSPFQAVPVPRLPVYDRGAKKEVLHPLRRETTDRFGGVYFRKCLTN